MTPSKKISDAAHLERMGNRRRRQREARAGTVRHGTNRKGDHQRYFTPAPMQPIRANLSRSHPDYDTSPDIHLGRKASRIYRLGVGPATTDAKGSLVRRAKRGAY